jgi:RNA polymerase sigma-70 factor (ECF subfamily)
MQWVLRAQCRDREAFEALLGGVQPALRRYLLGLAGPDAADDLLQDVLIIVIRRIGSLDDPALFRPWLFRIASREAFRYLKKRRTWSNRHEPDTPLDELPATAPTAGQDVMPELLASEAISPASRAVLMLHFQEELTLPAIAAILALPLGTVKSRLAYGLRALRRVLTPTGGTDESER